MSNLDSTVSARVPREIRSQGDAALKRIDSSVTDLVNAAFEYVIKTGSLPAANTKQLTAKQKERKFTVEQRAAFDKLQAATSIEVPGSLSQLSAKEIKAMRLNEKYGV